LKPDSDFESAEQRRDSPAVIGGRGLKQHAGPQGSSLGDDSPAVIGGRGLKHRTATVRAMWRLDSPAVIGGRGLKLLHDVAAHNSPLIRPL